MKFYRKVYKKNQVDIFITSHMNEQRAQQHNVRMHCTMKPNNTKRADNEDDKKSEIEAHHEALTMYMYIVHYKVQRYRAQINFI